MSDCAITKLGNDVVSFYDCVIIGKHFFHAEAQLLIPSMSLRANLYLTSSTGWNLLLSEE